MVLRDLRQSTLPVRQSTYLLPLSSQREQKHRLSADPQGLNYEPVVYTNNTASIWVVLRSVSQISLQGPPYGRRLCSLPIPMLFEVGTIFNYFHCFVLALSCRWPAMSLWSFV